MALVWLYISPTMLTEVFVCDIGSEVKRRTSMLGKPGQHADMDQVVKADVLVYQGDWNNHV